MKIRLVAAQVTIDSPVGELVVSATPVGIAGVQFAGDTKLEMHVDENCCTETDRIAATKLITSAVRQLDEYFAGQRKVFDLVYDLVGTEFQLQAWNALARIPFGETVSYKQQAIWVARPTATRAVGAANGRNPVAIVLPCHRVIGANGSMTGFGGGIERKEWLLQHESGQK